MIVLNYKYLFLDVFRYIYRYVTKHLKIENLGRESGESQLCFNNIICKSLCKLSAEFRIASILAKLLRVVLSQGILSNTLHGWLIVEFDIQFLFESSMVLFFSFLFSFYVAYTIILLNIITLIIKKTTRKNDNEANENAYTTYAYIHVYLCNI